MTDILDMEGWTVTSKALDSQGYRIEAQYTVQPAACIKCGAVGELYRHGPLEPIFRDAPIRGNAVFLVAKSQRYRCRACKGTFMQPLGGIDSKRNMTIRLIEYIQERCLNTTFLRLAADAGTNEKTVRQITDEYVAALDAAYKPALPEWLGMDEVNIFGKHRCVITDVGNRAVIDMLDSRDYERVARWFASRKDRATVRGIAIDMWRPYKKIRDNLFTGVPVVIDRFHVVRLASRGLDKVRIRLGNKRGIKWNRTLKRSKHVLAMRPEKLSDKQRLNLDLWLADEPDLKTAYQIKESFYAIYEMEKERAVEAYDSFYRNFPASFKKDFRLLLSAMKNWRTEILAFFDHRITNGYTEAVNGVAKVINRAGRGYTFEMLRAKLLWKDKTLADVQWDARWNGDKGKHEILAKQQNIKMAMFNYFMNTGQCFSCHRTMPVDDLQIDHIKPIVDGEKTINSVLICPTCHERFHKMDPKA